jgi:phosphate:Na+ symporter
LATISAQPLLAVLVSAVLTWAAHSSVAIVLVIMSFATKGTIPPDAAFALVLGANLGTAINPVLEGAGGDRVAMRLPVGNLVNRIIGVGLVLALLPHIGSWLVKIDPNPAHAVADFHTAFNLALALLFFPILRPYADLLCRFIPAKVDQDDPGKPLYLDAAARETPVVALAGAAREALRMADMLDTMLLGLRNTFEKASRQHTDETKRVDDILDRLNTAIDVYVTTLDSERLGEDDHRRIRQILLFAANLKHAGDIIDKNLFGTASKMVKRGVIFAKPEQMELLAAIDRLAANLRMAASLFMTGDMRTARQLAAEKGIFRTMEIAATDAHFERLAAGQVENAANSAMHLDALRDLASVNAQLVAGAAYPVLESRGELLESRVRQER